MKEKIKKKIRKLIALIFQLINIILIWLTIIIAIISIFKKEWIESFIEWMKIVIEWMWVWNYVIAFISSLIEAFPVLWVVVPGQNILLIVWWFFWNISNENLIYVWIIASIWAIIWNYIWYLLWKIYWDSFFKKYWLWFWIWLTEVKYLKKGIQKWWALWIIFWKFHPITRAFLPFIAWSMWMNSVKFMIYNIIWSIVRAITIITLWVLFVEYYQIILEHIWKIMMIIFWVIWIYIYKYKRKEFMTYIKEKNEELENVWR